MGQYYIAVNIDKEEYIEPHNLGTGHKMLEMVPSNFGQLLIYLQSYRERHTGSDFAPTDAEGRWAGDRVVIIGDHSEYYLMFIKLFDEVSDIVGEIYNEAIEDEPHIQPFDVSEEKRERRRKDEIEKERAEELLKEVKGNTE